MVAAGIALGGCGSGDSTLPPVGSQVADQTPGPTRGSLEFHVVFPAKRSVAKAPAPTRANGPGGYDGSIPLGSNSVKISVSDPTTGTLLLPARVVSRSDRPNGVNGTITVGFALLPVGPIKVDVAAYPSRDATGNALAIGTTTAQIVANATMPATVLMALTVTKLVVGPPSQTIHTQTTGGPTSVTIDGQAQDAQGNALVYPLTYSSDNTGIADVTAVSADFMHATVTGQQTPEVPMTVTITVMEPNSGLTGTANVIVEP
jgi:hypothetical protein